MSNIRKSILCVIIAFASLPIVGISNVIWLRGKEIISSIFLFVMLFAWVFAALYAIDALKDRAKNRQKQSNIKIDDWGVTRSLGRGKTESVAWTDLIRIEIVTTNSGPWFEDLFWVLSGSTSGCVVPNEDAGIPELMDRLEKLEGYNLQAVMAALASTSNNRFLLWGAPPAP